MNTTTQRTPERCGTIPLAHAEDLIDIPAAVATTAGMLRDVMTWQSLNHDHEWPETWHSWRINAVLGLIDASATKLMESLTFAIEEGNQ